MYQSYDVTAEQTSIEASRGKAVQEKRKYKIAFFSESSELLETIKKTK